jgi:hypothetical protein
MKLFSTLLLLVCISSVYGCATVTRGTSDVLVIESEPPGAEVEIQPANHHCKTPCSVKLKRKLEQVVTIRRENFEPVEVRVIPQVVGAGAAGMAGNVILGGLIGAAVDAGSGAMKDLKPNPVKVTMVASPAPAIPAASPADTSVSTQAVSAGG